MKKYLPLLIMPFFAHQLFAQNLVAKRDTGIINGAAYTILFPQNWQGKLVMFAHGYEFMGILPRQSKNPGFPAQMTPFLQRGFAVAASDYSIQGFAFAQGIRETEALRRYFVKKYGKPDTTFMAGQSMGGGIAVATIEQFGQFYNGALPFCPLSSRPYLQERKEFDERVIFNALFPGLGATAEDIFQPGSPNNPTKPPTIMEAMQKAPQLKKAIIGRDSALAVAFAKHYDVKLNDLAFTILFNELVLRDIAIKAKGMPFDNTNTIYSGFADNYTLNKMVHRFKATVDPNILFATYDRTGKIKEPVLLMHTLYDQLIPPVYGEVNFENMVTQQGNLQYLTVKYTNGQGHCAFTPEQVGIAFDELRQWAKTGNKAEAGLIE